MKNIGNFLIVAGIALALLGLIFKLGVQSRWLGKLPGDIILRRGSFTFYFPFATSLLFSLVLSLLLFLVLRILGKD